MPKGVVQDAAPLDVARIRADFPILHQDVHGHPLAYLDNAATTQKPKAVIEALRHYYEADNSNVHRGVHALSERATRDYEGARADIARFIGAERPEEIVLLRGTTEAINLVANSFVRGRLQRDDEILITNMEHHANIVPWQLLCQQTGAKLKVAPILDDGSLDMDAFGEMLNERTRFASVAHVSNALGTVNDVKTLTRLAHDQGVPILVDGAQAAPHMPVDVADIGCDFYTVSAHKMYGPTGTGALYGRHARLEAMPPWQGGGDMIRSVTFEKTEYNDVPFRFEAGTPNIAGVIGFGAAIRYLEDIGMDAVAAHEQELLRHAHKALDMEGVRIIGTAPEKAGVVSFTIEGVHPHDIGTLLDREGLAIRTGHHCAQPVMQRFAVPATARASFGIYNVPEEIDRLAEAIGKVQEMFA